MHWVKERVMECPQPGSSDTAKIIRIHRRLRSDFSMWYQVVTPGGLYDREPVLLEEKFERFLSADPNPHGTWSEEVFDKDFEESLQGMKGKEVTPVNEAAK
jgi:hypothetical protein